MISTRFECCCKHSDTTIVGYNRLGFSGFFCTLNMIFLGSLNPYSSEYNFSLPAGCNTRDVFEYISNWSQPIYSDGSLGGWSFELNDCADYDCSSFPSIWYDVDA